MKAALWVVFARAAGPAGPALELPCGPFVDVGLNDGQVNVFTEAGTYYTLADWRPGEPGGWSVADGLEGAGPLYPVAFVRARRPPAGG